MVRRHGGAARVKDYAVSLKSCYNLPHVVGEQYILTSVLEEREDSVIYAATQKDMQREVKVESLRPEAEDDEQKCRLFLDNARARVRCSVTPHIAATLELLYAEGTWHLAEELIKGEPLDMMLANGRVLSGSMFCLLLLRLCRACMLMDAEGLASLPFSPAHVYLTETDFRFDNPAVSGPRANGTSRQYLRSAAQSIAPLLDPTAPEADRLAELVTRMRCAADSGPLCVLGFDEEVVRLQMSIAEE